MRSASFYKLKPEKTEEGVMLSRILGIIWILLGALWIIKPQILRDRMKKKMTRKLRWIVFIFIMAFGFSLIGGVIRAEGFLLKIVGIIGLIIVIKGALLATSKTSEKILSWWQSKPILFFRIWGFFVLIMGVALMFA